MLERGSIEAFFLEATIRPRLIFPARSSRSRIARSRSICGRRTATASCHPGVAYFFSRPSSGSGCKRLNLFLRWMVRHDAVDFGLWTSVPAAKLIVPLDTHVIRVGRCLRLTRYTSPGWKMAADITASLRSWIRSIPVKYDFSLCHIGMADQCGFNRAQGDSRCPLSGLCRPRLRDAAGVRSVNLERLLDHPLGAEDPLDALESGAVPSARAAPDPSAVGDGAARARDDLAAARAVPSRRRRRLQECRRCRWRRSLSTAPSRRAATCRDLLAAST